MAQFVVIGARGWLHPGWEGEYYPDDMPPEWRLDYYAHLFRSVLVPWEDWRGIDDVTQWTEDVGDEFRFFLELPCDAGEQARQRLETLAVQFGSCWGGLLVTGDTMVTDFDGLPPGIVARDGEGQACAWRDGRNCRGARIGLVGDDVAAGDLRTLKERIVAFMTQGDDDAILYLFFEGRPPSVRSMQDAATITEILGVA